MIHVEPDFLECYLSQGYSKTPRFQSKEIVEFTKSQPCCVTGHVGDDVDFHHVVYRSTGNLASDVFGVPLKHEIHLELHGGVDTFREKYNVNFAMEAIKNLHAFLAHRNLNTRYAKR